jgi:hypothetical protein
MNFGTVGTILLLLAVSGLLMAYNTDSTPLNWPYRPLSREENPRLFETFISINWGLVIVGVALISLRLAGIST